MEAGTCQFLVAKLPANQAESLVCNSPERIAQGLLPPSSFTCQGPLDSFPSGPHFTIPKEYSHRRDEELHSQTAEHREVAVSEMNTCPP